MNKGPSTMFEVGVSIIIGLILIAGWIAIRAAGINTEPTVDSGPSSFYGFRVASFHHPMALLAGIALVAVGIAGAISIKSGNVRAYNTTWLAAFVAMIGLCFWMAFSAL